MNASMEQAQLLRDTEAVHGQAAQAKP